MKNPQKHHEYGWLAKRWCNCNDPDGCRINGASWPTLEEQEAAQKKRVAVESYKDGIFPLGLAVA